MKKLPPERVFAWVVGIIGAALVVWQIALTFFGTPAISCRPEDARAQQQDPDADEAPNKPCR